MPSTCIPSRLSYGQSRIPHYMEPIEHRSGASYHRFVPARESASARSPSLTCSLQTKPADAPTGKPANIWHERREGSHLLVAPAVEVWSFTHHPTTNRAQWRLYHRISQRITSASAKSLSLSLSHCLSLMLCVYLTHTLTLSLTHICSLSLTRALSYTHPLSLSLSLSLSHTHCLSVTHSVSLL